MGDDDGVKFYDYDLTDPITSKMVRVNEVLAQYDLHKRVYYPELLRNIKIVVLLYDRVENGVFALNNLWYKRSKKNRPVGIS